MPRYLYVKEAAQYLHRSPQTLRNWDAKGILPAQRSRSGQRLWDIADLEAFRAEGARTNTALARMVQAVPVPTTPLAVIESSNPRYRERLDTEDQNRFDVARAREEQTSGVDEIALVEMYVEHLLERLTTGGDLGGLWPALHQEFDRFQRARSKDDTAAMHGHMVTMEDLIKRGTEEHHLWTKLGSEIDRLRLLRLAEHKRQIDTRMLVTMEESLGLLGQMIQMVQQTMLQMIGDDALAREIFAVISQQYEALLTPNLSASGETVNS